MMINIDGFIPKIDFEDISQTYSSDKCAYCGRKISVYTKELYIFNNKPICRNCLLNMYERYRLSTIYFFEERKWRYLDM